MTPSHNISPKRKRLNSAQREALYDVEKQKAINTGKGEFPICKLCDLGILPGQTWDENHNKYLPHALGGLSDGIGHSKCNRAHGALVATPQVAKFKRIVRKHLDIHRTRTQIAGGKSDRIKKKMDGTVVLRATGERA